MYRKRITEHARDYAPTGKIFQFGPWQIPYKAAALCSDGKWRMAITANEADTWFSLPAFVRVQGKKVNGYITSRFDTDPTIVFQQYRYTKHANLLPDIPSSEFKETP